MKVIFFFTGFFVLAVLGNAFCMSAGDMIRLKKNGISDETVQVIIKEKALETCLFSVDEIVELRNAGISDETVRMLVSEGSFIRNTEPVIYGKDIRSIKFTTAGDIIDLKKAGVSEETLRAIIIYGSRNGSKDEREKAWDMLKSMGIIVDLRNEGKRNLTP
ncbi:hypothetical protein BuS5_02974 [Desulfosarcina sp. BuS5]|uniref:hypothetical protein n=1 Tax=Desulfosarcina sp. BuS5 TaxID=933262 RepID=UPI000486FDCB|nr:hypothetical protein [Desulfosarcina sp. BuS5]WDN90004.1 hypothetical protein BuS5_02974 [Desulfosarcina sp. BuS5]